MLLCVRPLCARLLVVAAAVTSVLLGGEPVFSTSPHPEQDIKPQPDFMAACVHGPMRASCISESVAAIEDARAQEPMRRQPLTLPTDYRSLSPARQAFVVINLERVDRGLRPIKGMVAGLNRDARAAAAARTDPRPRTRKLRRMGVRVYRSLYARDFGVLAADYEWMYDDGYASGDGQTTNAYCPSADAAGCWGHRAAILDPLGGMPVLIAGAGETKCSDGGEKVAAVLAGARGRAPRFTYTWRQALAHGSDGHPPG